jgi:segregation and condensation protein B
MVPTPSDDPALHDDEDPLEAGDLELALAPTLEPESDDSAGGDVGASGA